MAKKAKAVSIETVTILHFTNRAGGEYIVLVEDGEDADPEEHCREGYEHYGTHRAEIENGCTLPMNWVLAKTH